MLPGILCTITVFKIKCPRGIDLDSLEANYCKRNGVQQIVLTYDEDVNVTKARYQVPCQYTTNSTFTKAYRKALQKRLNKEYVGQKDSHKNRSYVINLPENIEVETTFINPFTFTPEEDPFFM